MRTGLPAISGEPLFYAQYNAIQNTAAEVRAVCRGFRRAEGDDELLQRVLWKLSVRRGSFPFLPELGSRLYLLGTAAPSVRALAAERYVTEALAPETALRVEEVRLRGSELTVTLIRAGTERELRLPLGEVTA